ncbi:hypothetical protein [Pseudoalteromonas prydzensis]|uniref:hypothetical protein n=1 Tax=Pseudoalteromonas prydzensis TaxID=182141 RepID=UPI003FD00674
MARQISVLKKINGLSDSELKKLIKELFHLESSGVYPENSEVKVLAREIANELEGVHLNHAQEMVNSEVLRVVARKFISKE